MAHYDSRFFNRHLDFGDQIGEALFALIMAMSFVIAVRMGMDDADNRTLFFAILGCNVAWALVDAVIFLLLTMYERMRNRHVALQARQTDQHAGALHQLRDNLDETLASGMAESEREALYQKLLQGIGQRPVPAIRLNGADFVAAFALAMVSMVFTVPVLLPFLFIDDAWLAVRGSNAVGVLLLFLLGYAWAHRTGGKPWLLGLLMALIGIAITIVTVLLGG